MSYILTALRKAEKERESATAENFLVANQGSPADEKGARQSRLIVVLSLLLVACIGLLLGAVFLRDNSTVTGAPKVVSNAVSIGVSMTAGGNLVAGNSDGTTDGPPEAAARQEQSIALQHSAATEIFDPPGETAVQSQPTSAEKTTVQPETLPPLNVTGYIFFEEQPERSKLFVDGIVYRINSRISPGLSVTGFARNYVILSYHGSEQRLQVK